MPPASLSTFAVMKPGPTTAKTSAMRTRQLLSADIRQSRCRSIEITSSAVMMPEMRPCSSTTASVMRLYLSKSAATSSWRIRGARDVGFAQLRELHRWRGHGDLHQRHGADQLLSGSGEVDRGQRFAAAFESLQRVDRFV